MADSSEISWFNKPIQNPSAKQALLVCAYEGRGQMRNAQSKGSVSFRQLQIAGKLSPKSRNKSSMSVTRRGVRCRGFSGQRKYQEQVLERQGC